AICSGSIFLTGKDGIEIQQGSHEIQDQSRLCGSDQAVVKAVTQREKEIAISRERWASFIPTVEPFYI
ncbi:MAG: hypothetical protein ACXWAB_09235, partial [Methylobacter sp.]